MSKFVLKSYATFVGITGLALAMVSPAYAGYTNCSNASGFNHSSMSAWDSYRPSHNGYNMSNGSGSGHDKHGYRPSGNWDRKTNVSNGSGSHHDKHGYRPSGDWGKQPAKGYNMSNGSGSGHDKHGYEPDYSYGGDRGDRSKYTSDYSYNGDRSNDSKSISYPVPSGDRSKTPEYRREDYRPSQWDKKTNVSNVSGSKHSGPERQWDKKTNVSNVSGSKHSGPERDSSRHSIW